ncbi:DUF445 family protein [Clostridium sardiniense]|uniref:DUF445 family protein n=1 Tax=Clostridium sardiniense TaxID=29369 RepID=A0ABS7KU05_CLOSR|nr:DUF445 family protein [Clostridium sardiniense]MBY0754305.1 DUF445 family protein [Clostridium sardiniense]MDQ0461037.1 uncharacterized membrane protein YheB (UPF0754 family) [Clostridium sardiniense]
MNTVVLIIVLALVGGIIGWITNVLAIKLMFRPINPIKIPILNIEIIGLIPKRKKEIAKNIGEVVSNELLSVDDIINSSINENDKEDLNNYIKDKIRNLVNEKMDFIPAPFRMMVQGPVDKIINEEVDGALEELEEKMLIKVKERIDIEKIVEEKVNELDLLELERIIISVAKKELKHIEILGFFLGGIIGLIQGIIVTLI